MSHIIYEYLATSHPYYRMVTIPRPWHVQAITLHQDLKTSIYKTIDYPKEEKKYFLLDEERFSFYRFDIHETKESPYTIHDLNDIVRLKCDQVRKKHHATGEKLLTFIDTIYVNGEEKKYLIGEKGDIFFRIYIVYVNTPAIHQFNSVYGNFLVRDDIVLVPQSMYTTLFLRNTLKKDNFLLLYIRETQVKAIKVTHGFYEHMYTLNLGIDAVKKMYKDNGIANYWYKDYDFIENNELAKQLVQETLEFYSQLLCKRLQENFCSNTDIILVSSMTKNGHFLERFNKVYSKLSNNYIVPFHRAQNLETFGKDREPEDMDILVALNRIQGLQEDT